MTVPPLPLAPEELARRLSEGLAPRPEGLELSVEQPILVEVPEDPGLVLRLRVTAATAADPDGQVWQLAIPLDPADLDPEVNPSALVTVLRANLEEWWDVKDSEPHIASWGRRLD
jgi:hypothetical protein